MSQVFAQSMRAPVGGCTGMCKIFFRASLSVVFDLTSLSASIAMSFDILFVIFTYILQPRNASITCKRLIKMDISVPLLFYFFSPSLVYSDIVYFQKDMSTCEFLWTL